MLQTSPGFYVDTHPGETEALDIIREFVTYLFGKASFIAETIPDRWLGPPNWVEHPWAFYDVVPDFLNSSGYWEHIDDPPDNVYFDGGPCDSCTFYFRDTTFYLLLTNGSP